MRLVRLTAAAALLCIAGPAFAHPGHDGAGFTGGLVHPLTGLDHLLAMIAIGLAAGQRGGRALWAWPLTFIAAAGIGFGVARFGIAAPIVEPTVLASVFLLGLLVASAAPVGLGAGAAIIAVFGFAHGQAHAGAAGGAAIPAFAAGFLLTSAVLHLAGLGLSRFAGKWWVRLAGLATMGGGFALAFA